MTLLGARLLQELQLTLAISDLEDMMSRRLSITTPRSAASSFSMDVTALLKGASGASLTSMRSEAGGKPPLLPSDSLMSMAMDFIDEEGGLVGLEEGSKEGSD